MKAHKIYECENFTNWSFGKYRVTTYPNTDRIYMVLSDKTSIRVVGRHIELAAKTAITEALYEQITKNPQS